MNSLSSYAVRHTDGSIDTQGTVAKFEADLLKFIAEREIEQSVIADAVSAVFAKHPGARINMPALVSLSCTVLNVQASNYATLSEKVAEYVRENASPERADGRLFKIGKGKGGGVVRWADVPEETPAPASK